MLKPDVIGLTLGDAQKRLSDEGVDTVVEYYAGRKSVHKPDNTRVIRQREENERVVLTVSDFFSLLQP